MAETRTGPNKIDRAVEILECDLEAEVNALSVDELKRIALKALRLRCYDRARSNEYNRINAEKRRAYYHATKHRKTCARASADIRPSGSTVNPNAPNAPKALH